MGRTRALTLITVLIGAAFLYLPALVTLHAQQDNAFSCSLVFGATVRQGPSAGTVLTGTLDITLDATGALTGKLTQENQVEVHVTGQVTGQAINLVFELGGNGDKTGAYIFGVGTALQNLRAEDCGSLLGGPFVGPKPRDSGDWLAAAASSSDPNGYTQQYYNTFGYVPAKSNITSP